MPSRRRGHIWDISGCHNGMPLTSSGWRQGMLPTSAILRPARHREFPAPHRGETLPQTIKQRANTSTSHHFHAHRCPHRGPRRPGGGPRAAHGHTRVHPPLQPTELLSEKENPAKLQSALPEGSPHAPSPGLHMQQAGVPAPRQVRGGVQTTTRGSQCPGNRLQTLHTQSKTLSEKDLAADWRTHF